MNLVDMEPNLKLATFESHREYLQKLAYRMLGSLADAEDLVQETWLRWQNQAVSDLLSPRAWLGKVITRLCLDQLKSVRNQRETYVGPWLPEPYVVSGKAGSGDRVRVPYALMVILERLTPNERAVFLLFEVFGFRHEEIAEILEIRADHCRQLVRRARRRIDEQDGRFQPEPASLQRLYQLFQAAVEEGDLSRLISMFRADIKLYADGGGRVPSALRPIFGEQRVARFLAGVRRKNPRALETELAWLAGEPVLISREGYGIANLVVLEVGPREIRTIYMLRNPEKLRLLNLRQWR